MPKRHSGHILNVTSMGGIITMPGIAFCHDSKFALAMLKLIASDDPPAHLWLGRDAISLVREKLGSLRTEFDAWEQVSSSTDFE